MIVRGTSPTHKFVIPFPISNVAQIEVLYSQDGQVVLKKEFGDLEIDDENNCIYVNLTQADTLAFSFNDSYRKNIVLIQLRVLMESDKAYASNIIKEKVVNVLNDEEIFPVLKEAE